MCWIWSLIEIYWSPGPHSTLRRKYLNYSLNISFIPWRYCTLLAYVQTGNLFSNTDNLLCGLSQKSMEKLQIQVASMRKCSLWNNDWNSHLIIIVICPHAVHTVVTDKRFKVSLTAKDSDNYSVYQKKGEECSREHGQKRISSHTRLLQEACHLLQDMKLECTLN